MHARVVITPTPIARAVSYGRPGCGLPIGPCVARTQGSRRTRSSTTKGADRTRRPPPVCLDGRRISSPRRYRRGARRATWTAARKAKGGSRPRSQSSCSAEGCTARGVRGLGHITASSAAISRLIIAETCEKASSSSVSNEVTTRYEPTCACHVAHELVFSAFSLGEFRRRSEFCSSRWHLVAHVHCVEHVNRFLGRRIRHRLCSCRPFIRFRSISRFFSIIGRSRLFLDGCARTALIWPPQHDAMLANSRALRSGVNERPS